jgi:hypothetical protein
MGIKLSKHFMKSSNNLFQQYSTKQYIDNQLDKTIDQLTSNYFTCSDSGHAYVMLGPHKCGKTDILKEYATNNNDKKYNLKYSNGNPYNAVLKVLYISNDYLTHPDGLIRYIQNKLFPSEPNIPIHPFDNLNNLLEKNKIYLVIIMDHMEQILKEDSNIAYNNLYDISNLALTESGRIALIGCTSSSLLYPILIGHTLIIKKNLQLELKLTNRDNIRSQGDKLTLKYIPGYTQHNYDINILKSSDNYITRFCQDYPDTIPFAQAIFDLMYQKNKNNLIKSSFLPLNDIDISNIFNKFTFDIMWTFEIIFNFLIYDVALFVCVYKHQYDKSIYHMYPNSIESLQKSIEIV